MNELEQIVQQMEEIQARTNAKFPRRKLSLESAHEQVIILHDAFYRSEEYWTASDYLKMRMHDIYLNIQHRYSYWREREYYKELEASHRIL